METRVPDETALGAEYPKYGELSPEWKGHDRVFVHKQLFDEMATGLFCPILGKKIREIIFCDWNCSLCWKFISLPHLYENSVISVYPSI